MRPPYSAIVIAAMTNEMMLRWIAARPSRIPKYPKTRPDAPIWYASRARTQTKAPDNNTIRIVASQKRFCPAINTKPPKTNSGMVFDVACKRLP